MRTSGGVLKTKCLYVIAKFSECSCGSYKRYCLKIILKNRPFFHICTLIYTAKEVGIDGLIVPDLPVDVYHEQYRDLFQQYGLLVRLNGTISPW